ncbi:MAG: SLC13/DASS family transporter [Proteobacteria bacterium]|nr:SLC13/DASS family transporter [Pseudomonadota bacterium]
MNFKNTLNVILALCAGFSVRHWVEADASIQLGLFIFVVIGWLWVSEAVNISVTALLVPVLAVVSGLFPVREAFANFANPIIFLFMGGFALAAGLQKHQLDKAFAKKILSFSGGRPFPAILLLFITTAVLSMWISNTATVAMMLPLALSLLAGRDPKKDTSLYLFVLLGLAYSGNLGGIATLIGSPPNAIAASLMGLSFRDWLSWGIPMFLLMFPIMVVLLYLMFRPRFGESLRLDYQPQPINRQGVTVLVIFGLTAMGWLFSTPLAALFGIGSGFDSVVAVMAILLLTGSGALKFNEFVAKTNWSILILFGGGLTLSAVLQSSGTSEWLAGQISTQLPADNSWLLLLIVCLFVIFLTELVSNTASAALLIPLFVGVAIELNLSEVAMAVVIALSASCAFMLPVATPPNAIVYSSGFVPQKNMLRAGLLLNLCFALLIATIGWWWIA